MAIAPPARAAAARVDGPLLDGPVSRSRYTLGGGDVVEISMFGDLSRQYTATVGPEGTLLVPGVGIVDVNGLSLDQAEARVRTAIAGYYRNVTTRLTLAQVRSFKVFLLGDVQAPGVRTATSVSRVAELVPADSVVRRNILLRHAGGDSLRVDLARFLRLGDLESNPRLREGDVVLVPPLDRTIAVVGRVAYPGTYEYRPGESLAQLLSIANGGDGFPADAADTLRLTRPTGGADPRVITLSAAQARGAEGARLLLQPFDRIYVPAIGDFARPLVATVTGQVLHPGVYPIEPGVTTVRELVRAAGGFLPDAALSAASLRRSSGASADEAIRQLKSAPPTSLSNEEQQIVQIRTAADPGNVVIDLEALFRPGSQAPDEKLQAGDVLDVPRRVDGVMVLGAVQRPGLVAFNPGQRLEDFVKLAGGFASRADKGSTTVLKAKLGNRVGAGDILTIEPGDQIVVPFKRHYTFTDRMLSVQAVMGMLSALTVTIFGLSRL